MREAQISSECNEAHEEPFAPTSKSFGAHGPLRMQRQDIRLIHRLAVGHATARALPFGRDVDGLPDIAALGTGSVEHLFLAGQRRFFLASRQYRRFAVNAWKPNTLQKCLKV